MKKLFSILLSLLIPVSGMNIYVASHICMGQVAAKKISLSGAIASCGMEHNKIEKTGTLQFTKKCCDNKVSVYNLNEDYTPSSFQLKKINKVLVHYIAKPVNNLFQNINLSGDISTNVSPPDISIASVVKLADICIFRL